MENIVKLNVAATRDFLEEMGQLNRSVKLRRDNACTAADNCVRRYTRLEQDLADRAARAKQRLQELQSVPEDSKDVRQIDKVRSELIAAEDGLQEIKQLWQEHYPAVRKLQARVEDECSCVHTQMLKADQVLERYAAGMKEIRNIVSSQTGNIGNAAGPVAARGWCPGENWFSAVEAGKDGNKTVTLTIGGKKLQVTCDKTGLARAYRTARSSGDEKMVSITSAMFEVEDFRDSLNLGFGHPSVPQLGGYHGNVSKQDPKGYESHHIPSNAAQKPNAKWLPALSITKEDHALTASYRGRQSSRYASVFSQSTHVPTYKETVIGNLKTGTVGYLHAMKCEILDLKDATGSKYDGAISAFLDAVQDMLSTRGVPGPVSIEMK